MVNNIRALRKSAGLTMKQFGSLMGVSESTISLYETGKNEPDISMLKKTPNAFAMEHSDDTVKAYARYLTGDVEDTIRKIYNI